MNFQIFREVGRCSGANVDAAAQYNNPTLNFEPATGPVVTVTATSPVKIYSLTAP